MAYATQVQSTSPILASQDCFQRLEGAFAPRDEARGLFVLIRRNASSVEDVRDLIAVSPRIEAALKRYMGEHPEDAPGIEKMLGFRKRVMEEFDRLVCESGNPSELRECVIEIANQPNEKF
jgi:hypothetical protein